MVSLLAMSANPFPLLQPNILLITTDQQRWDTLGVNGNRVIQTAHLDALAAGGTNFTRAYSTTPSCIAARRTLLTGQHGSTHGMVGYQDGVEFQPEFTLPGLLGQAGYQTQLIGKLHQYPQRKRYGFDHLILSEMLDYRPGSPVFGQNDYVDWLRDAVGGNVDPSLHGIGSNSRLARPFHLEEQYHHTSWVVQEAARFLNQRRDPSCPWFLHLSFWAPHPPLVPPQFYYDHYARRASQWQPTLGEWSPRGEQAAGIPPDGAVGPFDLEVMRNAMAGYYGLIHHVDDALGFLLPRVFMHGLPAATQPTWIIFTSDHGEMLGDHQLFRKVMPYEGSTHVPLFVSSRNINLPRQTSDTLACLEDICPTILDMAGAKIPESVDGHSLLSRIQGASSAFKRDILYGEHSGSHANHWIIKDRLKYCWFALTNEEQLFDLATDPYEARDLSGDVARLQPFRLLLAERLKHRTDYRYDPAKLKPADNQPPTIFWPSAG